MSRQCLDIVLPNQHGFYPGRSTTTNLVSYVETLLGALETGVQVDAVYTDFSRAFDRVNHNLLIAKPRAIGFHRRLLNWLEIFLRGRVQVVRVGSFFSREIRVPSGVPQGAHCSPLLFNLFVNDLNQYIINCDFLMFADDLKLFKPVKSHLDMAVLQSDVSGLAYLCSLNGLSLNVFGYKFLSAWNETPI